MPWGKIIRKAAKYFLFDSKGIQKNRKFEGFVQFGRAAQANAVIVLENSFRVGKIREQQGGLAGALLRMYSKNE